MGGGTWGIGNDVVVGYFDYYLLYSFLFKKLNH
jgi:hypothetical protein